MKTINASSFISFGSIVENEAGKGLSPDMKTITLSKGESFTMMSPKAGCVVVPQKGVLFLGFMQTEKTIFLLDRNVMIKPDLSFSIQSPGDASFILIGIEDNAYSIKPFYKIKGISEQFRVTNVYCITKHEEGANYYSNSNQYPFFEMIYIEKGHLFNVIDSDTYQLSPMEVQFILPNQTHHQYCYQDESVTFYSLVCSISLPEDLPLTNRIFQLTNDERNILDQIIVATLRNNLLHKKVISANLEILIVSFLRTLYDTSSRLPTLDADIASNSINSTIVNNVIRYLQDNQDVSNAQLAKHFGVSESYLSHLVSKLSGKSISVWRKTMRLNNAMALLRSGNHSITDVANQLDYSSVAYFSSEFKKHFGITPSAFIKDRKS